MFWDILSSDIVTIWILISGELHIGFYLNFFFSKCKITKKHQKNNESPIPSKNVIFIEQGQQNLKPSNDIGHFHSFEHQIWLPYKILCGKTVKKAQINPKATEIWSKKLNVAWVNEVVSLWHLSNHREAELLPSSITEQKYVLK